jgi:hypothetical protein
MAEGQTGAKDVFAVIKRSPSLMIALGVVAIAVVYYEYQKSKAGLTAATGATASTQPAAFAPATGTYTYEQDIHQTHVPTPITIQNIIPGATSSPLPGAPPPPTVITPTTPVVSTRPGGGLIPTGMWPKNIKWVTGNFVTWAGSTYTLNVGNGNRIWGVPGKVSAKQAIATSIPPKFLLYQG